MHIARRRRQKEHGGIAYVRRRAPAAGRNAAQYGGAALGISAQGGGVVGLDIARRYGIDIDVPGRPFAGKEPGQADDTMFRGGVGGDADAALEGQDRCDIDDAALALLSQHVAAKDLREKEQALQIEIHHLVPIGFREIDRILAADDAGIVDKPVERT